MNAQAFINLKKHLQNKKNKYSSCRRYSKSTTVSRGTLIVRELCLVAIAYHPYKGKRISDTEAIKKLSASYIPVSSDSLFLKNADIVRINENFFRYYRNSKPLEFLHVVYVLNRTLEIKGVLYDYKVVYFLSSWSRSVVSDNFFDIDCYYHVLYPEGLDSITSISDHLFEIPVSLEEESRIRSSIVSALYAIYKDELNYHSGANINKLLINNINFLPMNTIPYNKVVSTSSILYDIVVKDCVKELSTVLGTVLPKQISKYTTLFNSTISTKIKDFIHFVHTRECTIVVHNQKLSYYCVYYIDLSSFSRITDTLSNIDCYYYRVYPISWKDSSSWSTIVDQFHLDIDTLSIEEEILIKSNVQKGSDILDKYSFT